MKWTTKQSSKVMLNLFQHLFERDSETILDYCFTLRSRSFYLLCKYYSLCSVLLRVSDCVLTLHKIRKFGMMKKQQSCWTRFSIYLQNNKKYKKSHFFWQSGVIRNKKRNYRKICRKFLFWISNYNFNLIIRKF